MMNLLCGTLVLMVVNLQVVHCRSNSCYAPSSIWGGQNVSTYLIDVYTTDMLIHATIGPMYTHKLMTLSGLS